MHAVVRIGGGGPASGRRAGDAALAGDGGVEQAEAFDRAAAAGAAWGAAGARAHRGAAPGVWLAVGGARARRGIDAQGARGGGGNAGWVGQAWQRVAAMDARAGDREVA